MLHTCTQSFDMWGMGPPSLCRVFFEKEEVLDSPYLKLIGPAVAEIFRIPDAVVKNSQAESVLKWGSACIFTLKCCLSSLPFFLFVLIFDRKAAEQLI